MRTRAALAILVAAIATSSVGAMISSVSAHGTFGLTVAWRGPELVVTDVSPRSPAANAGLAPGDRIGGFPSLADRVALTVQSNLRTGTYLALHQPVTFRLQHGGGAARYVTLRAAQAPRKAAAWFLLLRLAVYLLGVLVAAALVMLRPSIITWSFALFVMLAEQPNVPPLEWIGMAGSPVLFLAALFTLVPCAVAVGMLGLLAFAARFPQQRPHDGYGIVELAARAFLALVVLAFIEYYLGQMFGWPALSWKLLTSYALYLAPAAVAIVLLALTLFASRGEARIRLAWAFAGPAAGTLLTQADVLLLNNFHLPYVASSAMGLLSSITPFAMMYAILRHRVIDIGFTLNRALVQTAAQTGTSDRSSLVRQAALLLSADLPLHDVYEQLAELLARFVDATSVLIAVGNADEARLEYNFEDGRGARPDNVAIPPDSTIGRVLRGGQPLLLRHAQQWPMRRAVAVAGRETKISESAIFVPVTFGGETIGAISVQSGEPEAYSESDVALLETCALYLGARMHDEERALNGTAPKELLDRSAFDALVRTEYERCARAGTPISLILLDLDLFTEFNDAYGHAAADTCLRQIGSALERFTQNHPSASASRYADDLFAIALPDADLQRAVDESEKLLETVRGLAIAHQRSSVGSITASVGVASSTSQTAGEPSELFAAARGQLERAKNDGRNRAAAEGYESQAPHVARRTAIAHELPPPPGDTTQLEETIAGLERVIADHPLVSVIGPAASGKTTAALAAARHVADRFADGAWYLDCSTILTPVSLPHAIAQEIFRGWDVDADPMRLVELLRDKQLLLLLDNTDQLDEVVAKLVHQLLDGARRVHLVVAARRTHAIRGELYSLPAARHPERSIERNAVDLQSKERSPALRRLSAFAGSFTRKAAHEVAGAGDELQAFVDAGFVNVAEDGRYRLPKAIRDSAAAAVMQTGEARELARKHAEFFAGYAREFTQRKGTLPFREWSAAHGAELAEYRIAVRRSLTELDDDEAAADILGSLTGMLDRFAAPYDVSTDIRAALRKNDLPDRIQAAYWLALAELHDRKAGAESMRAARHAFDLFRNAGSGRSTAYAAWQLAAAQLRERGHIDSSMLPSLRDAVATAKTLGDRHLLVGTLCSYAYLLSESGRNDEARESLHEAAELADRTDPEMLSLLLGNTALEEFRTGNTRDAINLWRQAGSLAEPIRATYAALCFAHVGMGELKAGSVTEARIALRRAFSTLRLAGHAFGIALCFDQLAALAKAEGDAAKATRLAGFAQTSFERGPTRPLIEQQRFYQLLDELRATLGNAVFEREWNHGQWMTLDEASAEVASH